MASEVEASSDEAARGSQANFSLVVAAATRAAEEAAALAKQVDSAEAPDPSAADGAEPPRTISRRSGAVYKGQVSADGRAHGKGVQTWQNDHVYEGEWSNDTMTGVGRLTQPDQSGYTGGWEASLQHGVGCLVASDKSRYLGEWSQGKMHGEGGYTWPDGALYVGQFKDGEKSGKGRLRWVSGMIYDGEWLNDKEHGIGVVFTEDGRERKGEWEKGERKRWILETYPGGSAGRSDDDDQDRTGQSFEALEIEDRSKDAKGKMLDRETEGSCCAKGGCAVM